MTLKDKEIKDLYGSLDFHKDGFLSEDVKEAVLEFELSLLELDCELIRKEYLEFKIKEIFGDFNK